MYKWLIRAAVAIPLSLGVAVLLLYASYSTGLKFNEIRMSSTYDLELNKDVRMFWASMLASSRLAYQLLGTAVNPRLGSNLDNIYSSTSEYWSTLALAISFLMGLVAGLFSRDVHAAFLSSISSAILVSLLGASLSVYILTSSEIYAEVAGTEFTAETLTSLSYALASLQFISGLVFALVATIGGILATKIVGAWPARPSRPPTGIAVPTTEQKVEKPPEVKVRVEEAAVQEALTSEEAVEAAQPAAVPEGAAAVQQGELVVGEAELAAESTPRIVEEVPAEAERRVTQVEMPTEAVEHVAEVEMPAGASEEVELRRESSFEERLREIEELLAKFEETKPVEPEAVEAIAELPIVPATEAAELPESVLEELMSEETKAVESVEEKALIEERAVMKREAVEISEFETRDWDSWSEVPNSGPLRVKVPCPLCGNALTWDESSARYYCRRCDVFV